MSRSEGLSVCFFSRAQSCGSHFVSQPLYSVLRLLWSGLRQRLADAGLCGAISGLEFSDVTAAERERSGHQQQASWLTAANVSYGPPPLSHF